MQALREPTPARGPGPVHALDSRVEPAAQGDASEWLACRVCDGLVALPHDRLKIDGAHAHTFINPAGVIFRVGCFSRATGAVPWGEPSRDWTWFRGFEWRVAGCRGCGGHLGWAYTASGAGFVALILDRIVERCGPGGPGALT